MAESIHEVKSNTKANKFRDEGNALYRKNNFSEALIRYNKSLCFAETSVVKSLAYANRSAVYLETKKYQLCLDNIQLARTHGFPESSKLDEREVKCRDLKNRQTDPEENPWNFFKLSYPANKKLPFIVDCLELKEDPKYGRLIATNRDLKPGDIVFIEEPWFKFLYLDYRYEHCSHCFKENMLNLIPCYGRCVNTMFCSMECAKSASSRHFLSECGFPVSDTITRKLYGDCTSIAGGFDQLHSYFKLKANKKFTIFDIDMTNPEGPQVKQQQLIAFLNLNVLPKQLKEHNAMPFKEMAKDILNSPPLDFSGFPRGFQQPDGSSPETYLALEAFLEARNRLKLLCSNDNIHVKVSIESPEGSEAPKLKLVKYGSSILLCGALFNHSCDPNVIWCTVENKCVALVRHPIKAGEQLFVCYRGLFLQNPLEVRRKILLEECGFFCECNACINGYTISYEWFVGSFAEINRVTQLSPSEMFEEFKKNCDCIHKNFKNHPCRETIFPNIINSIILKQISDLGSFKGSLKLSANK